MLVMLIRCVLYTNKMVQICYLCGKKPNATENISLHRFPKERQLRLKWLSACNLSEADDVSKVYICSCHFKDKEKKIKLLRGKFFGNCLLPGVVPSISVTNAQKVMYIRNETVQRQDISIRESVSLEGKMICDISNELATVVDTKVNYHRSPTLCVLKEITEPTDIASENIPHISSGENSNNEAPNDDTGGFEVDVCTPKKRRVAEPRFISEICVSDVATPRRAKRVITLVKQNDAKKREQIKQLHRQNRKLLKRITYLEDMMKNTKLETLYNVYM